MATYDYLNQTGLGLVWQKIKTLLNGKVDKETGKVLSSNDFTDAYQTKLEGIAAGAEVNVNADWNASSGDAQILNKPTVPTAGTGSSYPAMDGTRSLGSNAGYARVDHVHPHDTSKANLASPNFTGTPTAPTAASGTDTTQIATTEFVQATVASGGVTVDSAMSSTSTNPVQNKIIKKYVDDAIPTKTSDLTNDSGFITGYTETDPTVPSWAKASSKPSYTASEVGAVGLSNGYADDSQLLSATTLAKWQAILS